MTAFSPRDKRVKAVSFEGGQVSFWGEDGLEMNPLADSAAEMNAIRGRLERVFAPELGFGSIQRVNYVDGVRLSFDNGDVAHFRPSGNADELRIYAVADTQEHAESIAKLGVIEPNGLLRRLERAAAAARTE